MVTSVRQGKAQDFGKRLSTAVERHPLAPAGHGRQRWLARVYEEKFGDAPSAETFRKWFSGEARPRPAYIQNLAILLDVDEAWLALGKTPSETPVEAKKRNARAGGAVNYVAGLIELHGGSIAFHEGGNPDVDFHAIIGGKIYVVEVKLARPDGEGVYTLATSPNMPENSLIFGVIPSDRTLHPTLLKLSPEIVRQEGVSHGGYVELKMEKVDKGYRAGNTSVPVLTSFRLLD